MKTYIDFMDLAKELGREYNMYTLVSDCGDFVLEYYMDRSNRRMIFNYELLVAAKSGQLITLAHESFLHKSALVKAVIEIDVQSWTLVEGE